MTPTPSLPFAITASILQICSYAVKMPNCRWEVCTPLIEFTLNPAMISVYKVVMSSEILSCLCKPTYRVKLGDIS